MIQYRSECTFPVQSRVFGTEECNICTQGFYYPHAFKGSDYRINKTTDLCKPCPANTTCVQGTSLQTIQIDKGFWRDSNNTQQLYKCPFQELCLGGKSNNYCEDGYEGPLCMQCSNTRQYFNSFDGICSNCRIKNLFVAAAIILAIVFLAAIFFRLFKEKIPRIRTTVSNLNLLVKLKIFVSFYQILSSLKSVYTVQVDGSLIGAVDFMNFFSLDLLTLFPFPVECIGKSIFNRNVLS